MYIKGLKYACSSCIKGHRSSSCSHTDRPLFEIRKKGRPVSQCTFCRDLRKTKQVHIKCVCTNKKENQPPILIYQNSNPTCSAHNNIQSSQGDSCTCSIVTDTSAVSPSGGESPIEPRARAEEPPYSWALVTSPSQSQQTEFPSSGFTEPAVMDDQQHLGFVFHKPPSAQRILDGQPRVARRRSGKKTPKLSPAHGLSTPPLSSGVEAMPLDYPKQPLEALPESWANAEELTAILNTMFERETPLPTPRSHCGSFNTHCCQPVSEGESVVITITPLAHSKDPHLTTTRIITCYCGSLCTCPGCLVHPNHFFLANDPYSGPPLLNSSASSSYGSDEEDMASIYSHNIHLTF
ncbi:copper fist DNA binding domain-containing protein [Sporodiniella umbellata]|nr:copper fist DNA binding domain-containing protein [Sporodiniella umbellata]